MIEENKSDQSSSAPGVQTDTPKKPGGPYQVQVKHLLYANWKALKIDRRTWYWKQKKRLVGMLLEPFAPPIPLPAKILADLTATNILIALRVEGIFHIGQEVPSNTLRDYVSLVNSNSANLVRLYEMAKNGNSKPTIPGLDQYLASLSAKIVEG